MGVQNNFGYLCAVFAQFLGVRREKSVHPEDKIITQNWLFQYIELFSHRKLWMIFAGFLCALAMAPLHLWFCGLASILVLMFVGWVCTSGGQAQRCGWCWGYGFYMGSLYWIGHGLWVDAARFAWFWPVVFLVSPALIALYIGIMMGILVRLKHWMGMTCFEYSIGFTLMWSMAEWTQGHAFTGFPWTLLAYMWGNSLALSQMVAYVGSYGLSVLTVGCVALMGGVLIAHQRSYSMIRAVIIACSIGIVVFTLCCVFGRMRLDKNPTQYHEKITVRCVQPAINQKEKINPNYALSHWDILWTLSHTPTPVQPTVVIWPEGALPWCITPDAHHALPEFKASVVLIGGDYRDHAEKIYNALLVKDFKGIFPIYAKRHLLPFGEYVPGRTVLEQILPKGFLRKITPGQRDFSNDFSSNISNGSTVLRNSPSILNCRGLPPFRCLICYESIFPGTIRTSQNNQCNKKTEPQWILTITNDAWFGHSSGPYQHFLCSRFRAIEEGLPLVRVANTGISAIIDPMGRVLQSLSLGQRGVLDGALPKAIPITPYGRHQEGIWSLMMGILVGVFLILRGLRFYTTACQKKE